MNHRTYFTEKNTLNRLQGNLIKTIMGIGKNYRRAPLLKAINLSHISSVFDFNNLKLLNTIMKRNSVARQFNLLMIKSKCKYCKIM